LDDFPSLARRICLAAIAGLAVLLVLSLFADLREVGSALADFNPRYLFSILGLTLLNYLLRFLKWHYYLRLLGIRTGVRDSALIFTSGLSMSVTPAKLGEVFKSYLLNRLYGADISRTVPIVIAERVTDMLGLVTLAALSFSVLRYGVAVLLGVLAVLVCLLCLVQSRRAAFWILDRAARAPRIGRFIEPVRRGYESAYSLFRPAPLAVSIPLSVISWGFECVALYYVLQGFGVSGSLALSSFAFSFSSLAGAASMLPGGLAVAEGSLAGLLVMAAVPAGKAAGATVIIRFCTLWFGVALGTATLLSHKQRLLSSPQPNRRRAERQRGHVHPGGAATPSANESPSARRRGGGN
jgi:uncharacterized protein (TIRG00374 family)